MHAYETIHTHKKEVYNNLIKSKCFPKPKKLTYKVTYIHNRLIHNKSKSVSKLCTVLTTTHRVPKNQLSV